MILGKRVPVCEEEGLALGLRHRQRARSSCYSEALKALGFHPLPEFTPPEEPPAGHVPAALRPRAGAHLRPHHQQPLPSQVYDENEVWVNAEAARALPGFESEPLKTATGWCW